MMRSFTSTTACSNPLARSKRTLPPAANAGLSSDPWLISSTPSPITPSFFRVITASCLISPRCFDSILTSTCTCPCSSSVRVFSLPILNPLNLTGMPSLKSCPLSATKYIGDFAVNAPFFSPVHKKASPIPIAASNMNTAALPNRFLKRSSLSANNVTYTSLDLFPRQSRRLVCYHQYRMTLRSISLQRRYPAARQTRFDILEHDRIYHQHPWHLHQSAQQPCQFALPRFDAIRRSGHEFGERILLQAQYAQPMHNALLCFNHLTPDVIPQRQSDIFPNLEVADQAAIRCHPTHTTRSAHTQRLPYHWHGLIIAPSFPLRADVCCVVASSAALHDLDVAFPANRFSDRQINHGIFFSFG